MASVYVVEDEQQIRELVVRALAADGHAVRAAGTGFEALEEILKDPPDVVVLDLGLPDIDGSELLRMIRAVSDVMVIVATARDDDRELVRLLDAGADEYIVKPYSGAELQARVRALFRRLGNVSETVRRVGDLVIDQRSRVVTLKGVAVELNRKEFEVLSCLATSPGEVVTREALFAEVWRQPYGGADKTIDVHMSWLRRKLGETAADPRYLHTVRGVGMKLIDPT